MREKYGPEKLCANKIKLSKTNLYHQYKDSVSTNFGDFSDVSLSVILKEMSEKSPKLVDTQSSDLSPFQV